MRFALIFLLFCSACLPATAEYLLAHSVVANGAGWISGGGNQAVVTIGQALSGSAAGGGYQVGSGFWYLLAGESSHVSDDAAALPKCFALGHGLANPVRTAATLAFDVPHRSHVAIALYGVSGRCLRTLADATFEAGRHRVRVTAEGFGAGVYFCRMRAGTFEGTCRLVLLE